MVGVVGTETERMVEVEVEVEETALYPLSSAVQQQAVAVEPQVVP